MTSAVLRLLAATAHMLNSAAGNVPLGSHPTVESLVDSLASVAKCLIPSLRSRICHTIADLDGDHAASSIDILFFSLFKRESN